MSGPPLTVRNLTGAPLELKVVERYEPMGTVGHKGFANITHHATNLMANVTTAVAPSSLPPSRVIPENAQSFAREDVSVRIDPFKTQETGIKTTERSPHDITRLTFESEGRQYRIDTPTAEDVAQQLVPLGGDGHKDYTGVYLPGSSFLAIYSSADLHCWMQHLDDNLPLSALSIPGTHNSPTHHKALPSVRCQAVGPGEQLANGVRFFDIRVQPESPEDPSKDGLILVHGVFPISLTGSKYFRPLLDSSLDFLTHNPSETLIISLKREGPGNATDQQLADILFTHYVSRSPERFWTEPRIPTLAEARGKVVLMRRFCLSDRLRAEHDGRGFCLDAENWAYNTPNDTHGQVCVQDFCEVLETENIDSKIKYCCDHFERAGQAVCPRPGVEGVPADAPPPPPLFLNFLSASNFWKVGCWPDRIAAKLNPAVVEFLCQRHDCEGGGGGDGGVGIVVCDWVGDKGNWDLVRCIVGMNARLMVR